VTGGVEVPVPERVQVVPLGGVVIVAFPEGLDIEVEEHGGVEAVAVAVRGSVEEQGEEAVSVGEVTVVVPVVALVAVAETHEHTASIDAWICCASDLQFPRIQIAASL
jgi:hypothetical protein